MQCQSPIVALQRHYAYSEPQNALGYLGPALAIARQRYGLGAFGAGTLLTESATGVKTGVSAAGIATTIGSGVASAVGAGAAAGSFVPIIGTAIGIIVGLIASGVFSHRQDPEVGNFNNAMAMYAQNPDNIFNIADKYLVLAGLFDLEPGQIKGNIPIYKKYGRMGEQAFTQDFANLIYNAAQSGAIGPSDTPNSVMSKVVQPWIDNFGYGAMTDHNADMINRILTGMIAEYVTGLWKQRWYARAGDMPNWHIPTFTLPGAAGTAPGPSGTPTAAPVITAPAAPVSPLTGMTPTGEVDPKYGPIYTRPGDLNRYVAYGNGVMSLGIPVPTATPVPVLQTSPIAFPLPVTPTPITLPTPVSPPPQASAIALPPGFTVTGADANTNLPLYVGTDGRTYTWNGVLMSPFSGTALIQGQLVPTQLGLAQSASPPSMSFSLPSPMMSAQGFTPSTPVPAPGISPTVAGVSGAGLPSWLTWGAIGGAALLLLATARPLRGGNYKRAS